MKHDMLAELCQKSRVNMGIICYYERDMLKRENR